MIIENAPALRMHKMRATAKARKQAESLKADQIEYLKERLREAENQKGEYRRKADSLQIALKALVEYRDDIEVAE